MDRFRIVGPNRLHGSVTASGAKNAALPALAASLLSEDTIELDNVPAVRDIRTMSALLGHLGVEAEARLPRLSLRPTGRQGFDEAPYDLVKTMRASVLVLGPLVARLGHARVSLPGGCAIGVRPIDQHLAGLEALGAEVELEHGYVNARAQRLSGARFRFALPTVTGTENLVMAATLARGTTVLENCAIEPEVASLASLLNAMGARISGSGTSTLTIEGVESLHGARHSIPPDRIEVGTYLLGAAITGGDVAVQRADPGDLSALIERLEEIGCEIETTKTSVRVSTRGELRARDIVTAPHPGFPTDLQAQYMATMTQAKGVATICETVFENRFQHVAELNRLGAKISIDGAYARVQGPTELSGTRVMATDLRASACLVLAALAAHGVTVIDRIYHLDRGYDAMEDKLLALGAQVERVSGTEEPDENDEGAGQKEESA